MWRSSKLELMIEDSEPSGMLMHLPRRLLGFAAVLIAMTASLNRAHAQSVLSGRVLSDSGTPVAGATVTITSIRYAVRTDSLGRFQLSGTPGSTLSLTLQAAGLRDDTASVVLSRGRIMTRDFTMVSETTALPEANPSDRVLRGRITTTENEPIAYANLTINGGRRYVTDDSGKFEVPFNTLSAKIIVRRIGFEPTEVNLPVMPDTAIRVRMNAVARTLETQVVTVRSPFVRLDLNGFYARMNEVERGARVGYFVTPEDLAMRNPQNVTDAVEQFPSIRLRPIAGGIPLNRKMRIEDRNGCPFTVYLDKVRIQPSIVSLKPVDEEVNTLVQPHAVAGIEVYPRKVGAPPGYPAYEGGGICQAGVVLIWTK
jgi:hypothetical protein